MAEQGTRPGDSSEIPARDPSGGTWTLFLRGRKIGETARKGRGAALELAYTVPWAVMNPTAIFKGVREEGESEWLCYVSIPSRAYDHKTGESRPPWPGEVFLVFATGDRVIYAWRWEKASVDDARLPLDWEGRFQERVL
jgi:hypothetical protein